MKTFPKFNLENQDGTEISNENLKGKTLIYFYPKDNTPGCTTQACDLRDNMSTFNDLNIDVYGVSGDSKQKHKNFIEKHDLNFDLLVDEDFKLSETLGIYKEKKMFGKTFMGIERTSFLIDENSNILNVFEKVKPSDHVEDVKRWIEAND